MAKQTQKIIPDYKTIYSDILAKKYPEKYIECEVLLTKKNLTTIDILELNRKIFGLKGKETGLLNPKLRSYNESTILKILDYQKNNHINNSQLAVHFGLSRNTVAKWKKIFLN